MWRWIARNYRTFLWALALAVAVWIVAVTSADPDETRLLPNAVLIETLGQDMGLVISTDIPNTVELTLRAPHSVWEEIEANPDSVRAILDLSGLSAGGHVQELQIQIRARPVQIVSAVPNSITFTLEPLTSRTLDVDLSMLGTPAIGYQVGDAVIEPERVVVSGAQSQVQKVTRARLPLNVDGVRESIDQSLPLEILDAAGEKVGGLSVLPESIHVFVPVSQQGGYRDMAVKVVVTGQVASGYRLTNISVFPPVITVFSTDPNQVGTLPGVVETQPLDLQDADDDITTRLALDLPSGISIVGEQTVLIQAGVSPIESSITLSDEKVEFIGLASELQAVLSPAIVDVIVSGPLPLLDTLTRQDISVTIDLTNLEAGTYQLTPTVEILISDVIVESILPGTIQVILSPSESPTPTATP
jgi:YbbR domain-containing protein